MAIITLDVTFPPKRHSSDVAMRRDEVENARRQLLKGLGLGAACLPLLHASRSWAAGEALPKRFVCIMATEGYRQAAWKPKVGSLMTQTLPSTSSPLEPVKADLIFLPDMTNPNCGTGPRNGHEAYGTIMWGGPPTGPKFREPGGKTLDQVIVDGLPKTGRPSLAFQVQVDRKPSVGTTGARRCFWRGAGQPINPELNPQKTYADLFAGATANPMAGPETKRLLAKRKSLLDFVGRNLDNFKVRVAREDKPVIDGHLQAIRELESRLVVPAGAAADGSCRPATTPMPLDDTAILSEDKLYPVILHAYLDIVLAAVKCGITNVVTLQLGDCSGNSVNYGAFVEGIPPKNVGGDAKTPFRNWHDLGHNPVSGGVDHKAMVDKWWMVEFAGFVKKMKDSPEAGGSLLDHSLVLWGNHMESGDSHATQAVPWILAGKAGGYLATGQCAGTAGKPTNDAMAEICKAMGVQPAAHYGSGVPGLKA
jgi:hypothetical protein